MNATYVLWGFVSPLQLFEPGFLVPLFWPARLAPNDAQRPLMIQRIDSKGERVVEFCEVAAESLSNAISIQHLRLLPRYDLTEINPSELTVGAQAVYALCLDDLLIAATKKEMLQRLEKSSAKALQVLRSRPKLKLTIENTFNVSLKEDASPFTLVGKPIGPSQREKSRIEATVEFSKFAATSPAHRSKQRAQRLMWSV
jgi:hypothetical protein